MLSSLFYYLYTIAHFRFAKVRLDPLLGAVLAPRTLFISLLDYNYIAGHLEQLCHRGLAEEVRLVSAHFCFAKVTAYTCEYAN
jgi:hypothetical protein